jgi:hypothetical protein
MKNEDCKKTSRCSRRSAFLLCFRITSIGPRQQRKGRRHIEVRPVLNVLPLCRGITSQGAAPLQAGDRSVTLKQCLDAEQADRETMKSEWSTFSAPDKKHCIAEATMGGESSYTELVTCLEMARDVRKLRMPPVNSKQID